LAHLYHLVYLRAHLIPAFAQNRRKARPRGTFPNGALLGFSVPVFALGYLLAYIFALQLEWLPVQGYIPRSPKACGLGSRT
jgi:ABC-type dipeptide/oligopeptide/nickel transport system permease component